MKRNIFPNFVSFVCFVVNRTGFCRARLMEVTPEKEIVFDMWIDGSGENPALSLSSFRAEFVGESK